MNVSCISALLALTAALTVAAPLTEQQILDGAADRIEQHRKGQIALRLLGPDGKPLMNTAVTLEQTRHHFLFGSNIFKWGGANTPENEQAYREKFKDLLNYATLPFYWWTYAPTRDTNQDERITAMARWCRENGITPKGHPLAWNFVDPRWLPEGPAEGMRLQMQRIGRCVDQFEGLINIWDVVNEATAYDRQICMQRSPVLTRAIQQMGVGNYVRQAFLQARRANPDATLIINDYRTDQAFIDNVLKELLDRRGEAMYDVIGIQSHMHGGYWGAERTWNVCEQYARFGKPLHFTEVTVVSGPKTDAGWNTTPEGEEKQARQVVEFYRVLFSHPAVEAITWWDFSDQGAWQGAPAGFLRKDMSPKPVYTALADLIRKEWWTRLDTRSGPEGQVQMRGFYGEYRVAAGSEDAALVGTFSLLPSTQGPLDVQCSVAP